MPDRPLDAIKQGEHCVEDMGDINELIKMVERQHAELDNDARRFFEVGIRLGQADAEVERLDREVQQEHELNRKAMASAEQLQTALVAALEQNARFAAELTKLRTLIDQHNDECRECPVIES